MNPIPCLLLTSMLALLVAAPSAAAEESYGCHTWEYHVGDDETAVGVSPDDAAVVAKAANFYVISDGPPVVNPWTLSVWIYYESNGYEGLQRNDEYCDDTNHGQIDSDEYCLC